MPDSRRSFSRTRSMLRMMRFSSMVGFRSIQHSAASMMVRIVATDSTGYLRGSSAERETVLNE